MRQTSPTCGARAEWSGEQARARALAQRKLPAGVHLALNLKNVPGLADRAATAHGVSSLYGHTIGLSGIYLLKGATFLAFQDLLLGHAPPSTASMESEARTALSRVP